MEQQKGLLHPAVVATVSQWLSDDPDAESKLSANEVKLSLVQTIAQGACPEKAFGLVENGLSKASGINFFDLYFSIAKQQVMQEEWGGQDKLPEITTHRQLSQQLAKICGELGSMKQIAQILNLQKCRAFLHNFFKGKARGGLWRLKRVVLTVYCHAHQLPLPEGIPDKPRNDSKRNGKKKRKPKPHKETRAHPPDVDCKPPPGSDVSREVALDILSAVNIQLGILEKVLEVSGKEVLLEGDLMRAIEIILRFVRAFGISPETVQRLRNSAVMGLDDPLFQEFAGMANKGR